ncbi:MAG: hypothetical protein IJB90_05995 [Clostridia bacterium]|nr:hypothetical protein [Clostridia bacterium]
MTTTVKLLLVLLCVTAIVCISFIIAFVKKRNAYEELSENVKPYAHWTKFSDGTYAIPLTTMLYDTTCSSVGTVAKNFSEFSNCNLEETLENVYYGDFAGRTYLPVKILAADYNSNSVTISAPSGKRFVVMRSDDSDFPTSVNIKFTKKEG